MSGEERAPSGTQAIERGLDVLEVLSLHPRGLTPAELAELTGLSRPTAHRLLAVLQRRGFARTGADHGRYRLGFRLVELSSRLLTELDVRRESQPHLNRLVNWVEETVHLTALDGFEIVYLDKVESVDQSIRMASRIGARAPVHSTASGKAILAQFPEAEVRRILAAQPMSARTSRTITDPDSYLRHLEGVRAQGYAMDDIENEEGIICVAAPILSHQEGAMGAVSISGPAFRMTPQRLSRIIPALLEHTRLISQAMGWRGGSPLDG